MKINSGTFLSYLQLKESKNNCVQRLVEEDPQSDNTQEIPNSNTDISNYEIFLTGLYNINAIINDAKNEAKEKEETI